MADDLLAYNPDKPVTFLAASAPNALPIWSAGPLPAIMTWLKVLVPESTLVSGLFLQVKACRPCNDRKAALVDDIWITTMLPNKPRCIAALL